MNLDFKWLITVFGWLFVFNNFVWVLILLIITSGHGG